MCSYLFLSFEFSPILNCGGLQVDSCCCLTVYVDTLCFPLGLTVHDGDSSEGDYLSCKYHVRIKVYICLHSYLDLLVGAGSGQYIAVP